MPGVERAVSIRFCPQGTVAPLSMLINQTAFTLAPDVGIFTPVRPIRDVYARMSGRYNFTPNARVNVAAEEIVANNNSNRFGLNAGFRYGF
jgi:hypothetical protein